MGKSTSEVLAFRFPKPEKLENADLLGFVKIPDSDYVCVVNLKDWENKVGSMVAWIPPENTVNTMLPQFQFLSKEAKYDENSCSPGTYARIKAKKIRGQISYGLITDAPANCIEGEDVAEKLSIKHYQPENRQDKKDMFPAGDIAAAPEITVPYYDVDSFLKYGKRVFIDGEPVVVLEKCEGENSCFVYHNGEFHCKSRNNWKREVTIAPNLTLEQLIEHISKAEGERIAKGFPPSEMPVEEKANFIYQSKVVNFKPKRTLWWEALRNDAPLQKFLSTHPDTVVFAEKIGNNNKFPYDSKGKPKIKVFDIMQNSVFLDWAEARELGKELDWVPILHESFPFNFDELVKMADGLTTKLGTHIAEGICIRPIKERWNDRLGRVHLKIKNPVYLEKS